MSIMNKMHCTAELCIRKTHDKHCSAGFSIERTCNYAKANQCSYNAKRLNTNAHSNRNHSKLLKTTGVL